MVPERTGRRRRCGRRRRRTSCPSATGSACRSGTRWRRTPGSALGRHASCRPSGSACNKHRASVGQFHRAGEHGVEHRLGQPAGEGVLLAGMERAHAASTRSARPPRRRGRTSDGAARRTRRTRLRRRTRRGTPRLAACVSNASLALQERSAVVALGRQRLVVGRRALHRGRDPRAVSANPSSIDDRRRLVGQAGAVHRPEQEVAGTVAGEHPPGSVGAVGRRGQPEHQHRRPAGSPKPGTPRPQ